jgi:tetratricopeptide (TPR) repeat protein
MFLVTLSFEKNRYSFGETSNNNNNVTNLINNAIVFNNLGRFNES